MGEREHTNHVCHFEIDEVVRKPAYRNPTRTEVAGHLWDVSSCPGKACQLIQHTIDCCEQIGSEPWTLFLIPADSIFKLPFRLLL